MLGSALRRAGRLCAAFAWLAWAGCGDSGSSGSGAGGAGGSAGSPIGGGGGAGSGGASSGGSGGTGGGAGGSGTGGSGGEPISAADFPELILQGICRIDVACGSAPDHDTCMAATLYDRPWVVPTTLRNVASGKTRYDADAAAACVAGYSKPSDCTRTWFAQFLVDTEVPCSKVFTGTIPAGGSCFISSECEYGTSCVAEKGCDPVWSCCPGTCRPGGTPIPAGGDCAHAPAYCVDGTLCNEGAARPTCVALPKTAGTPCTAYDCAPPLFCDPVSKTCSRPSGHDAPCRYDSDLAALSCDDTRDLCDAATGRCLGQVPDGTPCVWGVTRCGYDSYCDTVTDTCVPSPLAGDSCTPARDECLHDLICDPATLTCVLPTGACP